MATAVEPVADADAGLAPSPKKKSSKLPLIIGGIGFIVTIQAVLTFLLMPKSEPAQPAAKAAVASAGPPASEDEPDQAEVSIGDFSNTNSTATPGVTIHFDFKLVAITTGKQQSQLTDLLKKNNARMRQVVGKIVRGASLDDLTDPTVATIRRLVREEINRLIRKSLIEEVVATDIRFVEQ